MQLQVPLPVTAYHPRRETQPREQPPPAVPHPPRAAQHQPLAGRRPIAVA